ncbi:ABC transporter permease [Streptomyces spiralis]|uniref:ABC transporter permease n=1 Tax=Streptomyces spiralis TaxID=66376 RepID=UPI003695D622
MAMLIFQVSGFQVGTVLQGSADGALTSLTAQGQSLRWAMPLVLMGLGVAVSFRAGYYNIGAQGQMYAGALVALMVALASESQPGWLAVPLSLVAGCVAGAIWAMVPGVLRVLLGADEVVTTLMGNFIGVLLLQWAAAGPLKSHAGTGQAATTERINHAFRLSGDSGVSLTLVALCCAVIAGTWALLGRTRMGLEITLAGRNPRMARWQGVDPGRLGLFTFAFAGATAGLAGGVELFGPAGALQADFSPDVGLMAVVVALVGSLSVWGVVVAAIFFGILRAATLYLPVVSDLPTSALDLLNGLVALLITVSRLPRPRGRRATVPPGTTPMPATAGPPGSAGPAEAAGPDRAEAL